MNKNKATRPTIGARVPKELKNEVKHVALAEGRSVSDVIQDALLFYLRSRMTFLEGDPDGRKR